MVKDLHAFHQIETIKNLIKFAVNKQKCVFSKRFPVIYFTRVLFNNIKLNISLIIEHSVR